MTHPLPHTHSPLSPAASLLLCVAALLCGCDRGGGADPRALSSLTPPATQDAGFLLQAQTGAGEGEACGHDMACARPLRCLGGGCMVPLAVDGGRVNGGKDASAPRVRFEPSGVEVAVEVADDPFEQQQGLMWRTRMAPDWGMLFVFPEERPRSFWMKNTYIPLDILYIREDGVIVSVAQRTTPLQLSPPYPSAGAARYVLEVNGGFCAQHGVSAGQRVVLRGL